MSTNQTNEDMPATGQRRLTMDEWPADRPLPEGGSPEYPLHSELTIGEYFRRQCAVDPSHEFVVYPDRALRWTYHDFDVRTDELAKGLLAIGMKPGDHLGVWARNIPDWLTFMYATAKVGIVMVTVNPVYKSHELDYVLKQSDMKALCVIDAYRDVDYLKIIYDLVPEMATQERGHLESESYPCLKNLIYMGPEKHRGFYSVPELLLLGSHMPDEVLRQAEAQFTNDDVVMMQYTSGTTGFPKGVMLTHRNILNNGFYIGEGQRLGADDRVTLPVPFFHCFGCVLGVMACLTHRSTMIIVEDFDAGLVLQAVHKERATAVYGVPTMFIAELNHPDFAQFDLTSLRTGIMAGSPCPPETMREVMERMNMREITICYGLTECSPGVHPDLGERRRRAQVRDRGSQAPAGERARDRPGRRPHLRRGRAGRAVLQGLQRHEGLLQDARGHRPGHRRRRLSALRRPGHGGRGRVLPRDGPHQGHDHPRRREHLPAGDRELPTHRCPACSTRRWLASPTPSTARSWAPSSARARATRA